MQTDLTRLMNVRTQVPIAPLSSEPPLWAAKQHRRASEVAESGRDRLSQYAGQWVLLEPGGRLLSIGDALFKGQSAKSILSGYARQHLLPALLAAGETNLRVTSTFEEHSGGQWRVEAVPVLGPMGAAHAMMGYFVHAGVVPEPQPVIGSWEWDNTERRTNWSRDVLGVFGFPIRHLFRTIGPPRTGSLGM